MNFSKIFNVFSKRPQSINETRIPLTSEFRNRVFLLWDRTFPRRSSNQIIPISSRLWSEVYEKLLFSVGRSRLSGRYAVDLEQDLINFLNQCNDEHFFDFIEFSFQSKTVLVSEVSVHYLIDAINQFFLEDNLPFALTNFTFTEVGSASTEIQQYPQVIHRDSEILHQTAIEPSLKLLTEPAFSEANKEFLNALADYRKGDYQDCIAKCGSSLESVMKIICSRKGWPPRNDAGKLLSIIISKTSLPEFFKKPLIQIAIIRNELSSSHGAGNQPRIVSKHVAQYTINVTASAILLLVEESDQ